MRLLEHCLFLGNGIDVLGEAFTSHAGRCDRGASDHEHRGGDASALQPLVELGE